MTKHYYLLTKSARGAFTGIAGTFDSLAEAEAVMATHSAPDLDIVTDLTSLTGGALKELHNAMCAKGEEVERFADKGAAVRRVLAAFATAALSGGKKPKAPRKVREPKAPKTIILKAAARSEEKIWHKESKRKGALDWITEHAPVGEEVALQQIAAKLNLSRGQVRGLLNKLVGVNAIEIA